MSTRRLISAALLFCWVNAVAKEPAGLSGRSDTYFETAVAVLHKEPELLEKDGRKYRILIQDIETEKIEPKTRDGNASGFFLFHKDQYYFATAQHVTRILRPSSRLGFVNPKGESRQFVLGKLVGKSEHLVWRHHDQTDVSLLKLHLSGRGVDEVADIAISSDELYLETPPRTSKLVVAGFPGGLGTRGGEISPITAVVHLASKEIRLAAKLEGVQVENAYLVNPPAGKGYSGAPIFYTDPEGKVKCAGMLNGAWSDPTGGKFSISTPARYLLDLVDK